MTPLGSFAIVLLQRLHLETLRSEGSDPLNRRISRCHGRKARDALVDGGPPDGVRIEPRGATLGSVDHQDNLPALHPVDAVGADSFGHLVRPLRRAAALLTPT